MAVECALFRTIADNFPIYPSATILPDGTKKTRTEWQNGWNEANSRHTKSLVECYNFLKSLSDGTRSALEDLLIEGAIGLEIDDDNKPHLTINVSDLFFLACADFEEVETKDIEEIFRIYSKYGDDGLLAWVALKRNIKPIFVKHKRTNDYDGAEKELNERSGT